MEKILETAVEALAFVVFAPAAVLTVFIWIDGFVILIAWFVFARIRNQKQKERTMTYSEQDQEMDRLFSEVLEIGIGPTLKAGDRAMEELEFAAILPDLEDGAVNSFHSAISNASKQLRKSLRGVVGPSTLRGVKKNVDLIWDQIHKSEEIRRRAWLEKNRHAVAGSLGVENLKASLTFLAKEKRVFEAAGDLMGFEANEHISDDHWGNAAANLTKVETGKVFASAMGMQDANPALMGGHLLSNPDEDPLDGWEYAPPADGRDEDER